MCKGTGELEPERRQPSQGQTTHDESAKPIGRSPVVDGAAPLCDGAVDIVRRLERMRNRELGKRAAHRLQGNEFEAIEAEKNAQALGEAREIIRRQSAIAPSQSGGLSPVEGTKGPLTSGAGACSEADKAGSAHS